MPRNVRNSWVAVDIDGRSTPLEGGPKGAGGGMSGAVYVRHKGEVEKALAFVQILRDDKIVLLIQTPHGEVIEKEYER